MRVKNKRTFYHPNKIILGTYSSTTRDPDPVCSFQSLGRGHYIYVIIHFPNYYHTVASARNDNQLLTKFLNTGEVLEDYPDSPGLGADLTTEAASSILDSEGVTDTSGTGNNSCEPYSSRPRIEPQQHNSGCHTKRRFEDSGSRSDCVSASASAGPMLPPIYHSVAKKRMSKTILRHLDGSKETDCTTFGASVSQTLQVGSFNNNGDRRHNSTIHRHDHTTMRNKSTSFDPSTLNCTTCPGVHKVLHRTVEGTDVGMNNPPVFILTDQNFPAMVPVGGGRGMS